MTPEKVGDKVEKPEAEPKEPAKVEAKPTLSPQEEADALRQQLADLEAKAAKWEEEAKAHQKVVSKKDQELQEAKQLQGSIDEIKQRLEMQEAYIAALGDRDSTDGEFGKKVQATSQKMKRDAFNRQAAEVSQKALELIKDTGLTTDSPELKAANLLWQMGRLPEFLAEVKNVVAKQKPKTEESKEVKKVETPEEMEKRLRAEIYKEKGWTDPEGGEPSGGSDPIFTAKQIAEMSTEEFEENREAINKARREGRIKK